MVKEPTIFDEILENLENKIRTLRQDMDKLHAENDTWRKEIDATVKSMDSLPWNEQAEARNDIHYYEGIIRVNEKMIEKCREQIQDLQHEIQENMKLKNPGKER